MNPNSSPYTTHITYVDGSSSKLFGWKRLIRKEARVAQIQEITPAAAVNRIASKPSRIYQFISRWKVKPLTVQAPTGPRRDGGYLFTSDGPALTNPSNAYTQAVYPKIATVSTSPARATSSLKPSSHKPRRHSITYTPAPSPTNVRRSLSSGSTIHRRDHETGPSAPKRRATLVKRVHWIDGRQDDNHMGERRHSQSDAHPPPVHRLSHKRKLASYDPRFANAEASTSSHQYVQAHHHQPQQLPVSEQKQEQSKGHGRSHSFPPQRRKAVPYHLIPDHPVAPVEQRSSPPTHVRQIHSARRDSKVLDGTGKAI